MKPPPTHYEMLNVSPRTSAEEIRDAYRALCRQSHPDRNPGDPEATETMAKINAAYEVLPDPERRREYDLSLVDLGEDVEQEASPAVESAHRRAPPSEPPDDADAEQRAANREFLTRVTRITIAVVVVIAWLIYDYVERLR